MTLGFIRLAEYVREHAVFTVEADEDIGILNTYSECGECEAEGPIPGAIIHKDGCIVKIADAAIAAHRCPSCDGSGSVRNERMRWRNCPVCKASGVKPESSVQAIFVNAREYFTPDKVATYDYIVTLARLSGSLWPNDKQPLYTVTWERACAGCGGTLKPGESVPISAGMVFDATVTGAA